MHVQKIVSNGYATHSIFFLVNGRDFLDSSLHFALSRYYTRMIAQIIPIDASYDSQALTYFVPESLRSIEIGQLVEMPFRDEITYGVVSAVVDFSGVIPDEIRAIVQIVFLTPILNPAQIQTICEIAKESVLHLHKVLALFLPKPVLIRMLKYGIGTSAEVPMPEPSKILKQKPVLHFLKNPEMLASYSQSLDTGKTVYIVPSDWYLSRLQMLFPTNTTGVLPGGMTDTKRAQLWLDVRVMKYPTLI